MSAIDEHPILGQLKESDRLLTDAAKLQSAVKARSRIMERDGKLTTIVSGIIGITGLFFMKQLPFFIILGLLVVGVPLLWFHLRKEAREFSVSDEEIEEILKVKS